VVTKPGKLEVSWRKKKRKRKRKEMKGLRGRKGVWGWEGAGEERR
jgi:hypothetical protein